MKLWRIATETHKYPATDLSGAGAAKSPGRWNDDREHVVYCAPTLAMAVLETASHVDPAGLPLNRYVIEISVPDDVWDAREQLSLATLPATWNAIPAGATSVRLGSAWLRSSRSAVLLVPSVIVPEEECVLINPRHGDASRITARAVRKFEYDTLFRAP